MRNQLAAAPIRTWLIFAFVAYVVAPALTLAGSIDYGDFAATTLVFQEVTETGPDDSIPLLGIPATTGDQLLFSPTSLTQASASGIQGQLDLSINFTVSANSGSRLTGLNFQQNGLFLYVGTSFGEASSLTAIASIVVTIEEIDGVAVAPIPLAPPLQQTVSPTPITAPVTAGLWEMDLFLDIQDQLDSSLVPYVFGVTQVSVQINLSYLSESEPSTSTQISGSSIQIEGFSEEADAAIPEPNTFVLMSVAFVMAALVRILGVRPLS